MDVKIGKLTESENKAPRLDKYTEALMTVDYAHHEIHSGNTFRVCTTAVSLADNGKQEFVITVGSTPCHAVYEGNCGGNAMLELYESPTGVSGTNAYTPRALNRVTGDSVTTVTSVISNPDAIAADGTSLSGRLVAGGTGGNATGGSVGTRIEHVLKPSTVYLLRLTNVAGAAKAASLCLDWYEHSALNT